MRIYWANSLFTEADRDFNAKCAAFLRASGFEVFLPQEAGVNSEAEPAAEAIFRVDSAAILGCDLMVACIDQETIDCGVACEVGFAYAYDVPVVGLYTDIRKDRHGRGRMYKNLYVIGAIERSGGIGQSLEELLRVLNSSGRTPVSNAGEASLVGTDYRDFVNELEGWYKPRYKPRPTVDSWMRQLGPARVLEIGCGVGTLGTYLCNHYANIEYYGFDISQKMISAARSSSSSDRCKFTSELSEVPAHDFDLVLALFTLHDHDSKETSLALMCDFLGPGGAVGIIDLTVDDLPHVVQNLRRRLALPAVTKDPRLDPAWVAGSARELGLEVRHCELQVPLMTFPSRTDLHRYFAAFGIYDGHDLPLALKPGNGRSNEVLVRAVIDTWEYPLTDQRVFLSCLLTS